MNSPLIIPASLAILLLSTLPAAAQGTPEPITDGQWGGMSLSNNNLGSELPVSFADRAAAPPVNNVCSGATVYELSPGQTVMMSGNNTGVVVTDPPGLMIVWEAFTLTACANVVIDYCVPGSVFTNHIKNLAVNCPDFLTGILLGANTACTVSFQDLAPGTYWIPVYAAAGITPQGPYTIAVTATTCTAPTAYCIPISTFGPNEGDYISWVQLGNLDMVSTFQVNKTYVDNTAYTTQLIPGQLYQISVISGAYNTDQVAAWIDYNDDFSFAPDEKLGEGTATSIDSLKVFTFTVPANAPVGNKRLRVRTANVQPGQPLPLDPCYNYSRCETEDYTVFITGTQPAEVDLDLRVFLQGPYVGSSMNDGLRAAGFVPTTEPYTGLGYAHTGGDGGETTTAAVLAVSGNSAVVDWVFVELRNANDPATVIATKSGLLLRDGKVVAGNGVSPLIFNIPAGNYHVAVRHRNHLGCMTDAPLQLDANTTTLDFTASTTECYGIDARASSGDVRMLWAGNTINDNNVKYTGGNNDRDPILARFGGSSPTGTASGYYPEDVNMDGKVKYTGGGNDRDPILVTTGSGNPSSVRVEQLP